MPLFLYLMTTSLIVIMANDGTQLMSLLDGSFWDKGNWTVASPGSKLQEDASTSPIVGLGNSDLGIPRETKTDEEARRRAQVLWHHVLNQSRVYGNDKQNRKKASKKTRYENPLINGNNVNNFEREKRTTSSSSCQDSKRNCDKNPTKATEVFNCTLPNENIRCYETSRLDFTILRPKLKRTQKYQRRSAEYPLEVDIFLNRRPLFGKLYPIFAVMPTLGDEKFVLNLTMDTNDYFIDEVVTDPRTQPTEWQYTNNFVTELQKRRIRRKGLTYTRCHFYVARASFYKSDHNFVIARVSSYSNRNKLLAAEVGKKIKVRKPPKAACMPIFSLPFCEDPNYPLAYWSRSHQLFMAVVTGDCGDIRYGQTRWDFYDLREKNLIKHVSLTKHFVLSLPPYGVYKTGVVLVLRASVKINGVPTVARCYLRYTPPKVDVRIVGNERRMADVRRKIILDGSRSTDLARPSEGFDTMNFEWTCTSEDDPENRYCSSLMSDRPVMRLPESALVEGSQYIFTLTVSSKGNPGFNQTARQLLLGVSTDTFTPDIRCISNCAYGVYAPDIIVRLKAECQDCQQPIVRYEWWVRTSNEDSEETLLSQTKLVTLDYRTGTLTIRLRVELRSNLSAEAFYTLRRNEGPNGSCTISPSSGIEAVTTFEINCRGFETPFGPLSYRYMVPSGIVGQSQYARYEASLVETEEVDVFICDITDMCTRETLDVDVKKFRFKARTEPRDRIREILGNVEDLIKHGFWNKAIRRSLVAVTHIHDVSHANLIFNSLTKQEADSIPQLERLAVLAGKLLYFLQTIENKEAQLLARIFRQMGHIYKVVVVQRDRLHPNAYYPISALHTFYMATLGLPHEPLLRPMCTPYDHECTNAMKLPHHFSVGFDPLILVQINQWLKTTWYLYKCVYFLGMLASQQEKPYYEAMPLRKIGISYQMEPRLVNDPIKALTMKTIDRKHELQLSAKLLDELRARLNHEDILFQIISQRHYHNMFWWYPDIMPSKSCVLIVHAYSRNGFLWVDNKSRLANPVVYKSDVTEFNRDEFHKKFTTSRTLVQRYEIHYYSQMLDHKAMLAVRIVSCSMPIHVNMRLHRRPTSKELIHDRCLVTPAMKGKRLSMVNGCRRSEAFVSIFRPGFHDKIHTRSKRPKKAVLPLNYSILLEVYQCNHFRNRSIGPGWATDYCNISLEHSNASSVHCSCYTLGVLATRIFPIIPQENVKLKAPVVLSSQWTIFGLLFLLLFLLGSIFIYSFGSFSANQKLVHYLGCGKGRLKNDPNREIKEEILLVIVTGGQVFAGTTSNVQIYLKSPRQPQDMYQITQDPGHPRLLRNTTNLMQVARGSVNIPTRLALGIERNGRYPSWYCRTVSVIDLELKRQQLFVVERWIRQDQTRFMRSKYFATGDQQMSPHYSWCKRFRRRFEQLINSWFCENPIVGPWQSSVGGWTINRVERASVMLSKIAVTITMVSLFYGKSSVVSIEKERQPHHHAYDDWHLLLGLSFFCFLCSCLVHMFFELFVLRWLSKRV